MSTTTIHFKLDEELKQEFQDLAENLGLTSTAMLTMFVKRAVADQAIPFYPEFRKSRQQVAPVLSGLDSQTKDNFTDDLFNMILKEINELKKHQIENKAEASDEVKPLKKLVKNDLSFEVIKEKVEIVAKKYDIPEVYLFETDGQEETDKESDLYLVIDYDKSNLIGLQFINVIQELEDLLEKNVDLVDEKQLLDFQDILGYKIIKNSNQERKLLYAKQSS